MKTSESKYCKCLYFTANALARKVEKLAIDSWKDVNLPPSHAYLLMLVIEDAGIQPGTLSEQLQLTPSTISRLIEKLEEKKLVVRITEGKQTNVYPTPKARELSHVLNKCLTKFYESYTAILGKEESRNLIRDMNKVSDQL